MPPIADFAALTHPFVWTTREERAAVLHNIDDPLWHRFLSEAELHFVKIGGLRPPVFPVWCHDGDLDEVMAAVVLAYVRDESRLWRWIADWLRGVIAYHRAHAERWDANLARIAVGDLPAPGNPRQFFEGFVKGGAYWVEGGFMTVILHLLDLLEAHAPEALSATEKNGLRAALAGYARRYAFHEEALKYSNRGMWANAGVLCAALAHQDPGARRLLLHQAARRHDELRTTFLDDGSHGEGAPDYHLMALDALLAYALPVAQLTGHDAAFAARAGDEPFGKSPAWTDAVRAYLRTVHPGPVLMNHPRGCSISTPVTLRPALLQAYRLTGDPEIGWFISNRIAHVADSSSSPLRVTPAAVLGLGQYQPLINFWLYRRVETPRPPKRRLDILPDHGGLFSRSGWSEDASILTARFGYEGTGKGHRDHGHVTVSAGGQVILADPFPRYGPPGLESSMFHNTVTLDRKEPAAVIGRLASQCIRERGDAFLLLNSGGALPSRDHLHDPREESNSWFTNHPAPPDFDFFRSLFHLHGRAVIGLDQVSRPAPSTGTPLIDWFFHTPLSIAAYTGNGPLREENYLMRRRNVISADGEIVVAVQGEAMRVEAGHKSVVRLEGKDGGAFLCIAPLDTSLVLEFGRRTYSGPGLSPGASAEAVDFIRLRASTTSARIAWLLGWARADDAETFHAEASASLLRFSLGSDVSGSVDLNSRLIDLTYA